MPAPVSFGRWLKQRRKALDLTQDKLAGLIACAVVTIQKIEEDKRRPSKQIAERLAEQLGVPPEERGAFVEWARASPDNQADAADTLFNSSTPWLASQLRTNLPMPLTPLLDRTADLKTLRMLLTHENVRLLTLVGPPGVGKTRLGIQLATDLQNEFADGVWWISLAPISDPALIANNIGHVLGLKEIGHQSLLASLQAYLHPKQTLLLLDNFEQVLDAAPLVADLLLAAPNLKILVTSREPLHLYGEQEYFVPPLAFPAQGYIQSEEPNNIANLQQYAAVELFVTRARAVKTGFSLTAHNARAIADICFRLDGLPLAIELAAVRCKLYSPQTILARLNAALSFLASGPRDLPPRQQTLRSAIAWSYSLLNAAEQRLFRRLDVFVGGFTVDVVEAVCNADHDLPLDVLDGLASLLNKNLLRQEEMNGEPRFTMLQTIREYAFEQLIASREAEYMQQHRAHYCLSLAEQAKGELSGPNQQKWLDRLESEHDNLRAALTWSVKEEGDLSLRLAVNLWLFWYRYGHLSEGQRWLETALTSSRTIDKTVWAEALRGVSMLMAAQGNFQRANLLAEESWALYQEVGDKKGIAEILRHQGRIAMVYQDYARAHAIFEETLTLYQEIEDKCGVADTLDSLGSLATDQGDYEQARSLFEESLAIGREIGDIAGIRTSLRNLGITAFGLGNYKRATTFLDQSLALAREQNDKVNIAANLSDLAYAVLLQGNDRRAQLLFKESLLLNQQIGQMDYVADCLEGLAGVAAVQGQPCRTACLFGATAMLRNTIGVPLPPLSREMNNRHLTIAKTSLSKATFAAAWAKGEAMTLEQAVAYALEKTNERVLGASHTTPQDKSYYSPSSWRRIETKVSAG
jgi:predicted ATPase/DNA-binding XRE family transcriptional regulator